MERGREKRILKEKLKILFTITWWGKCRWFSTEVRYGSDAVQANRKSWPDYRGKMAHALFVVFKRGCFSFFLPFRQCQRPERDAGYRNGFQSKLYVLDIYVELLVLSSVMDWKSLGFTLTSVTSFFFFYPNTDALLLPFGHIPSTLKYCSGSALPDCLSREPASIIGTNCLTSKRHLHWILFPTCGKSSASVPILAA